MYEMILLGLKCDGIDLSDIISAFPSKTATFPGKYLGLPLNFRHLRKVHVQPTIKLPGWMGKNLAWPGRITLAKTVLMVTAVYHATVIPLSKWGRLKIVRIARRFVWAGDAGEHDARGHALVTWKTVCRPKDLGGLGIPDLDHSGRTLRLRWLWLQWTDPTRSWSGSKLPCSDADRALFRACTKIELGDGEKTSFWHDKWCNRGPLQAWAPDLYKIATRK
jgi:hypothetical protein